MPNFPENKSPFMMSGMVFKEGQSPIKSKVGKFLKKQGKKLVTNLKENVKGGVGRIKDAFSGDKSDNNDSDDLLPK